MFLVHAENDPVPVPGTLHNYLPIKAAQIPAEMHVYPEGGHGYGLRSTEKEITRWPLRAEKWLQNQKLLERTPTRK